MDPKIKRFTVESTEEEMLEFIRERFDSQNGDFYLKYITNLLNLKNQKELFKTQNNFNINILSENKKLVNWTKGLAVATMLLVVATMSMAFSSFQQANELSIQIKATYTIEASSLMLDFNKELRSGIYLNLADDIANNVPLFKQKGGKYSEAEIDNYLLIWEMLNNVYEQKLITHDMLYDTFSYDLENAYCNSEIKNFIQQARKDSVPADAGLYGGFSQLASQFVVEDKMTNCPIY